MSNGSRVLSLYFMTEEFQKVAQLEVDRDVEIVLAALGISPSVESPPVDMNINPALFSKISLRVFYAISDHLACVVSVIPSWTKT